MFFISYAKNFFVPPSTFGIGSPQPVRSLEDALSAATGDRHRVVFVNNGYTGGDIGTVINNLTQRVQNTGYDAHVVTNTSQLNALCPSTLRGVSQCYGAAVFHSSPTQPIPNGRWNYTLRADGSLGEKIFVNQQDNDAQLFVLPFQHAIDREISYIGNGKRLPDTVLQYPFTDETQEERAMNITKLYQGTLISIIAVAFFIGMVGVTYQLVGHIAMERELGMSQLIEAMMPNARRWEPQVARLLSAHLAFDIIYLPGWIINGLIVAYLVFPQTNVGIVIGLHLLGGLALSSFSIFWASFFKRAQLSGITVTIASCVLAIVAQIPLGAKGSTGAVIILSLLFTPMGYTFFLIYMAGFQQKTIAVNLSEYSPATNWQVTGGTFWGILVVQLIFFPILGAIMENALYGTASRERTMHQKDPDSPYAVRLHNFSKYYSTGWFKRNVLCCGARKYKNVVKAVNDLTLNIVQGQIMILLGANGSGKSTTLDAIAGLNTVTQGSIEIDGRGGLGLCPQKNVLWDELSVYEHVMIFNRLKSQGKPATKAETEQLIKDCDLEIKLKAKAETLSGGQKRKLQLAMMFTGGSRVCCVDEVSSGIDPLARRKVWDILLAERGRRTILLTTHFLDEADVLSDHIAILSKGILKAEGTSVELKKNLGGGYRVFVANDAHYVPTGDLEKVYQTIDYDQTIYHLRDSADAAKFIATLEDNGVDDYRVQGPTVEDAFLKLADEIKDDLGMAQPAIAAAASYKEAASEDTAASERSLEKPVKQPVLQLTTGHGNGLFRQAVILFQKRFVVLRRNWLPHVVAVLIPIIAGGLVTLFLKNFTPLSCSPDSTMTQEQLESLASEYQADIPYGPASGLPSPQQISAIYPQLNASSLHSVPSLDALEAFVSRHFHKVSPGGIWAGDNATFAWLAQYNVLEPVLVQNIMDTILTGQLIGTSYSSFSTPYAPKAGSTIQLILYFCLAMSVYPAFFALYPTAERLRKVRALHYSNGIRALPIWVAYTIFDFIFVLLVSVVVIALFVGDWYGWYAPGYLFLVFVLYGLTSSVYCYAISLFTTSQLATFAFAAGSQAVLFLIYFIAYLAILTYAPVNKIDADVTAAHFAIAVVTPAGNLARAMLLTLNEFSLLCKGTELAPYPGAIDVYGGPILYLIVQFCVLLAFLVWWDSGGRIQLFKRRKARREEEADVEQEVGTDGAGDDDVREELARVQSSNDGLRVLHLTKRFGSNTAVEDITFGIRKSETFALLGPNGAGKSTTISLIRGDVRPSNLRAGADVVVEGASLMATRAAARNHLGVCPQFDAMDAMTVREHLLFYARVRGVPDVRGNVAGVMHAVGLHPYEHRLAARLSGGNKRKLSLAIALIGNPSVLLLDEPSSGMDAAAKRVMWRVLATVKPGRALLITTHSMEEADALADRAGIMARRMLALGTCATLRRVHGDVYHVHLVHKDAPHTDAGEMARVKAWVDTNVPGAVTEAQTYHGQLRFVVPNRPDSAVASSSGNGDVRTGRKQGISALFALLEANKHELGFAHYSVSPTTLDQVFLNVVQKHNVAEENYHTPVSPGVAAATAGTAADGEEVQQETKKGFMARVLRR